jgi:hypothetical protein
LSISTWARSTKISASAIQRSERIDERKCIISPVRSPERRPSLTTSVRIRSPPSYLCDIYGLYND